MRVKTAVEDTKKGVVYMVPCGKCEHVYTGETGKNLKERLKEHWYTVKKENLKMVLPHMLASNNTKWTGMQQRYNVQNSAIGRGRFMKQSTSANNTTPPTWTADFRSTQSGFQLIKKSLQ